MSFIRNIALWILVLITILNTLLVPLIYVDFEIRKDYISKILCIEREKPITVCGGSCYLKDRLGLVGQEQDKKVAVHPTPFSFFFEPIKSNTVQNKDYTLNTEYLIIDISIASNLFAQGVFHPPTLPSITS